MTSPMKKRWLVLAGVLALLAGTLLLAPAEWLAAKAVPDNAPIKLLGVSGELRRGRIQQIELSQLRPPKQLGPARWQLNPFSLLWLHPSLSLELDAPLLARGKLHLSPLGSAHFHDWRATGEVADLVALAGYSFLPVSGKLGLNIEQLDISGPLPDSVAGTAQLLNLQWKWIWVTCRPIWPPWMANTSPPSARHVGRWIWRARRESMPRLVTTSTSASSPRPTRRNRWSTCCAVWGARIHRPGTRCVIAGSCRSRNRG